MKYILFCICLIILFSGCGAQKLPEDSGSLPKNGSALSQAETESSSLPESSSQPEESYLSSQEEASSSWVEPEESGLLSEVSSSAEAQDLAEEIAGFEKNYYETVDPSLFDDAFYEANPILRGGKINCSKIVQCYTSIYNLAIEKEFDEFVAAYKQGAPLSELIQATNSYYTTVSGEWDVIPGTAEMEKVGDDYIVGIIYKSDNGKMFCLPEDKILNSEINKQYNSDNINGTFVIIYGIGCGMLLSNGKQESVILLMPARNVDIKTNTLFSADEFMTQIEDLKESIVRPPVEMEVNSDGEINAVTG